MTNKEIIYNKLSAHYPDSAVFAIMGNLYAESALLSDNLQDTYNKSLCMSDSEYTKAVDSGRYTNFVYDSAGYGVAQWTYWSRKLALYTYMTDCKLSIGDVTGQIDFLIYDLQTNYKSLDVLLKSGEDMKILTKSFMAMYERPADQSEAQINKRYQYAKDLQQELTDKNTAVTNFATTDKTVYCETTVNGVRYSGYLEKM